MPRPKESPSGKPSKPIASTQSLSAFVKGVYEVVRRASYRERLVTYVKGVYEVVRCPNASASS